jgi:hypothetical protein
MMPSYIIIFVHCLHHWIHTIKKKHVYEKKFNFFFLKDVLEHDECIKIS